MSLELHFSEIAIDDLKRLKKFTGDYSGSRAARRLSKQLLGATKKLVYAPQMGRWVSTLPGEVREMVFGKYIVRYVVMVDKIYILRIWHGSEYRVIETEI
jgi:plasmid stabilization system protein ParE